MISRNQVKTITSLHHKKFRYEEKLFIAEGEKVVGDALRSGWEIVSLYGTPDYFRELNNNPENLRGIDIVSVTDDELQKISALTTPQKVLVVVKMPKEHIYTPSAKGLKLVLDSIKDPGNLGALLRIADWFGISEVICSHGTVDCYNPKVVQGSMGSLFHVPVFYEDLENVFRINSSSVKLPVYGALLEGKNIFTTELNQDAFLIFGNESSGISPALLPWISGALSVPSFSESLNGKPDSLNVAVSAGIICAGFRRQE